MFITLGIIKDLSLFTKFSCIGQSDWCLAFMLFSHIISQSVPEILLGEESPGQLVDLGVCSDAAEILDVVPEIRGGVGPVGSDWGLIIGN